MHAGSAHSPVDSPLVLVVVGVLVLVSSTMPVLLDVFVSPEDASEPVVVVVLVVSSTPLVTTSAPDELLLV